MPERLAPAEELAETRAEDLLGSEREPARS